MMLSINQFKEIKNTPETWNRESLRCKIEANISYNFFKRKAQSIEDKFTDGLIDIDEYEQETNAYNLKTLDQVINYMLDILLSLNNEPIQIGDDLINRTTVQERLMQVGMLDMKKVICELNTNPNIKNPKKYAISMLYNS